MDSYLNFLGNSYQDSGELLLCYDACSQILSECNDLSVDETYKNEKNNTNNNVDSFQERISQQKLIILHKLGYVPVLKIEPIFHTAKTFGLSIVQKIDLIEKVTNTICLLNVKAYTTNWAIGGEQRAMDNFLLLMVKSGFCFIHSVMRQNDKQSSGPNHNEFLGPDTCTQAHLDTYDTFYNIERKGTSELYLQLLKEDTINSLQWLNFIIIYEKAERNKDVRWNHVCSTVCTYWYMITSVIPYLEDDMEEDRMVFLAVLTLVKHILPSNMSANTQMRLLSGPGLKEPLEIYSRLSAVNEETRDNIVHTIHWTIKRIEQHQKIVSNNQGNIVNLFNEVFHAPTMVHMLVYRNRMLLQVLHDGVMISKGGVRNTHLQFNDMSPFKYCAETLIMCKGKLWAAYAPITLGKYLHIMTYVWLGSKEKESPDELLKTICLDVMLKGGIPKNGHVTGMNLATYHFMREYFKLLHPGHKEYSSFLDVESLMASKCAISENPVSFAIVEPIKQKEEEQPIRQKQEQEPIRQKQEEQPKRTLSKFNSNVVYAPVTPAAGLKD